MKTKVEQLATDVSWIEYPADQYSDHWDPWVRPPLWFVKWFWTHPAYWNGRTLRGKHNRKSTQDKNPDGTSNYYCWLSMENDNIYRFMDWVQNVRGSCKMNGLYECQKWNGDTRLWECECRTDVGQVIGYSRNRGYGIKLARNMIFEQYVCIQIRLL